MNQDVLRAKSGAVFGNSTSITYPYPKKLSKLKTKSKSKKLCYFIISDFVDYYFIIVRRSNNIVPLKLG